jgi:hypothetical protein
VCAAEATVKGSTRTRASPPRALAGGADAGSEARRKRAACTTPAAGGGPPQDDAAAALREVEEAGRLVARARRRLESLDCYAPARACLGLLSDRADQAFAGGSTAGPPPPAGTAGVDSALWRRVRDEGQAVVAAAERSLAGLWGGGPGEPSDTVTPPPCEEGGAGAPGGGWLAADSDGTGDPGPSSFLCDDPDWVEPR